MSEFNLADINPTVSRVKVRIAYAGKNRKNFDFSKELLTEMIPSLRGTPIVAFYLDKYKDVVGHEDDRAVIDGDYVKSGKPMPYGFVDPVNIPWWEQVTEDDGTINEYLTTYAYLWKVRYPEEVAAIEKSGQSMEIRIADAQRIGGYITPSIAQFIGLCALNSESVTPTFESAYFEQFSMDNLEANIKDMYDEIGEAVGFAIEKGTKEAINISQDGNEAIDGEVGDKNIQSLKRKVVSASNYKTAIHKIFARYPSSLDDFTLDDIGYPLMWEKNGTFYYHLGFIKAASSRIEGQKDQPYYNQVKARIKKARKAVGMKQQFSMKGEVYSMDMDKMKSLFETYGQDKYVFITADETHMFAMDMEEMKPMKIAYVMDGDEYKPDMEDMGMMEDFIYTPEQMMEMMKMMYMMMMKKAKAYMSLESDLSEEKEKVGALETEKATLVEEKETLSQEKEALVQEKEAAFSTKTDLEKDVEAMKATIDTLTLNANKHEAEKIMSHEDFSVLEATDKEDLISKVDASTDLSEFTKEVEAFSFRKMRESGNPKDNQTFSMKNPNLNVNDNKKVDDDKEEDLYAYIAKKYSN